MFEQPAHCTRSTSLASGHVVFLLKKLLETYFDLYILYHSTLHVRVGPTMSELLSEMEEGGQSVDPEFVVDATQQQHVGDSPLLPRAGEAVDKGSEEQVGTGHLDDEGEDSHLMTGSRSLEEINAEGGHDEVGGDMDVEDNRVSSDNEEGKSQNGVEEIPSALVASAKPTRLVQLPLARVKK